MNEFSIKKRSSYQQAINSSQSHNLQDELNVVLSQLDSEDKSFESQSIELISESMESERQKKQTHQLFKGQRESMEYAASSTPRMLVANPDQLDLEAFKMQVKQIIAGGMSTPNGKTWNDEGREGLIPSQFQTALKGQNYQTKSRQVSIHTNAYLVTDIGDDLSHKHEMYSTMQTNQQKSSNHLRGTSNKGASFFTQTNNSFASIDNSVIPNEKDEEFDLEKFKQQVQLTLQDQAVQKRLVQKRLVTHDQEIKLRRNLKRRIRAAIEDPSQIPMDIYFNIIKYDSRLFKKLILLSKGMKKHLLFHLFDRTQGISDGFMKKYGQVFDIERREICLTPISFCSEEGMRLDLSLQVKVKPAAKKLEKRSVIIGYDYNNEGNQEVFQSNYQFDLFKKLSRRWLWLHKDECLFHGLSDARAYTIPIVPICVEDSFSISITLLSLMGSLNPSSLKWNHLTIEQMPDLDDVHDYNRVKNLTPNRNLYQKYFADLKRVCEAEDTVIEWFLEPYARERSLVQHIKRSFDTSQLTDQFDVMKVEVGGIDFSVWKVHLRAKKNASLEYKYYPDLNIGITVRPADSPILNEVKRKGFLIDLGNDIEVREKDEVIVYVSMGGWEK